MINQFLGIPPNASEHGLMIDHMLEFAHWFMAILFFGWSAFFLFMLHRFNRKRHPKADYHGVKTKASTHIEFMVVLVDVLLLIGFALPLWGRRVTEFPKTDAVTIRAVGQQFLWNFHYPGADEVFGKQDVAFINANNPLGMDPNDPSGKDDIVTRNEVHLPLNKNVIFEISSKDVIHSFSLQSMRIGQDAIPGQSVPLWFKPIKAGEFEIICGQLCGLGHYNMRALMVVQPQDEYDAWLKESAPAPVESPGAAPAAPSTAGGVAPALPPPPTTNVEVPEQQSSSVLVPSQQPPGAPMTAEPHPGGLPASAASPGVHK